MERRDSFSEVDEQNIVLDRPSKSMQSPAQLSGHEGKNKCYEASAQNMDSQIEPRSATKRLVDSIKDKKDEVETKIKRISKSADEPEATEPPILAYTPETKSKSRLAPDEPVAGIAGLKKFVHHPYDSIKAKVSNQGNKQVASQAGIKEIPHGTDVDIVKASTAVESAETEKERLLAVEGLSELLEERQNAFLRWNLDRHVTKIRAMPRETLRRKPISAFRKQNDRGESFLDWRAYSLHLLGYQAHQYGGHYIGYKLDPPTPSQQALMPNIERFIVVTSPFQQLFMAIRRIYCWQRPKETGRSMVIYFILWYLNLLLVGLLCSIVYFVIRRRIRKQSIDELREDIMRKEDVKSNALSLTEFVDKHGEKDWADKMLLSLGQWFMIQSGDAADFFETLQNFYEWRNPARTVSVLTIFSATALITAFTPTWLLLKASTFAAGIAFFCLFPIATGYPEYRLLASPSKRLLWNIPTHAEWAIKIIQKEGAQYKENATSSQPSTSISYKAFHNKIPGHLLISTNEIRFESIIGHKVAFDVSHDQIERLEKHDKILRKHLPTRLAAEVRHDLRLVSKEGEEWKLKDVERRNEVFTQVVGFSGVRWQVVW